MNIVIVHVAASAVTHGRNSFRQHYFPPHCQCNKGLVKGGELKLEALKFRFGLCHSSSNFQWCGVVLGSRTLCPSVSIT